MDLMARMNISNKYLEVYSIHKVIEYLLVVLIACSAVSSANPGKTKANLPTNALWLNSAGVKIQKAKIFVNSLLVLLSQRC